MGEYPPEYFDWDLFISAIKGNLTGPKDFNPKREKTKSLQWKIITSYGFDYRDQYFHDKTSCWDLHLKYRHDTELPNQDHWYDNTDKVKFRKGETYNLHKLQPPGSFDFNKCNVLDVIGNDVPDNSGDLPNQHYQRDSSNTMIAQKRRNKLLNDTTQMNNIIKNKVQKSNLIYD